MKKPSMTLIILGVFVVAISSCAISPTSDQIYWDNKVKELCEKDGGVTVYEHVELTSEEVKKLGGIDIETIKFPMESEKNDKTLYFLRYSSENSQHGSITFIKGQTELIRKLDNKIIARIVSYGRRGGDFVTLDNPSHFGCENIADINFNITKSVFLIKGE